MSDEIYAEMAILAAYLLESSEDDNDVVIEPKPRKRRVWRKDWSRLREKEGFCAKLLLELHAGEEEIYRNFVRMTVAQFDHLLHLVTPRIKKSDTNMRASIPPVERLVLTLCFLASGDNFRSLQYVFRIPQSSISMIVPEVLDAIYDVLVDDFIKIPKNETEWEAVANGFNETWQFPNCIGAVGGKHVVIIAPPNAGSVFCNYKGSHSIIVMGVVDADHKFLYVDVGRNGKFPDGEVFNRCTLGQALDRNKLRLPAPKALPGRTLPMPYVLVTDDAFVTRSNIVKPFTQDTLTKQQRVFNYRLSRPRRSIENVFGIMSARFGVLRKPINLDPEKSKKVVLACSVLHNYLITTNKDKYAPPNTFAQYDADDNQTSPGEWRTEDAIATMFPLEPTQNNTEDVNAIQDEFLSYFIEKGEVSWQYDRI